MEEFELRDLVLLQENNLATIAGLIVNIVEEEGSEKKYVVLLLDKRAEKGSVCVATADEMMMCKKNFCIEIIEGGINGKVNA